MVGCHHDRKVIVKERLLLLLVCPLIGSLVGCAHKRTVSVVMPGNSSVIYVESGGVIEWDSWAGTDFTITFQDGYDPCKPPSPIAGSKDKPALCHVKPHSDGFYHYMVSTGRVETGQAGLVQPGGPVLAARVGPCNHCGPGGKGTTASPKKQPSKAPPPGSPRATSVSENPGSTPNTAPFTPSDYPYTIDLDCVSGDKGPAGVAYPSSATAKAGDTIYWQKYGPDADYDVKIGQGYCSNNVTEVTSDSPRTGCTVAQSFTYSFTVGACTTAVQANVTVK